MYNRIIISRNNVNLSNIKTNVNRKLAGRRHIIFVFIDRVYAQYRLGLYLLIIPFVILHELGDSKYGHVLVPYRSIERFIIIYTISMIICIRTLNLRTAVKTFDFMFTVYFVFFLGVSNKPHAWHNIVTDTFIVAFPVCGLIYTCLRRVFH